jgi:hypothetical protein
LAVDVQQGARLRKQERQGDAHFFFLLDLPRALHRSEEHSYTMVFSVPPDQPMPPLYAFVPLVDCDWFRVNVRFDPNRLPTEVWRLERMPPQVLYDRLIPGQPVELDDGAEAVLEFENIERGFGYGIAWLP